MIKKIVFIAIFALVIITLVSLLFFNKKTSVPGIIPQVIPYTIPTTSPQPSPEQILPLSVLSTEPSLSQLQKISVGTRLNIYFNQPVEPSGFKFTVEPKIEVETIFLSYGVGFIPNPGWPLGKEVILIITQAEGKEGAVLTAPYKIILKAPVPEGE